MAPLEFGYAAVERFAVTGTSGGNNAHDAARDKRPGLDPLGHRSNLQVSNLHGRDDAALQAKLCELYEVACPLIDFAACHAAQAFQSEAFHSEAAHNRTVDHRAPQNGVV